MSTVKQTPMASRQWVDEHCQTDTNGIQTASGWMSTVRQTPMASRQLVGGWALSDRHQWHIQTVGRWALSDRQLPCPHWVRSLTALIRLHLAQITFVSTLPLSIVAKSILRLNLKLMCPTPEVNQNQLTTDNMPYGPNIITTWLCMTSDLATCWVFVGMRRPNTFASGSISLSTPCCSFTNTGQNHLENQSWQNWFWAQCRHSEFGLKPILKPNADTVYVCITCCKKLI